MCTSLAVPLVKMSELHTQYRCLQTIQATVHTFYFVCVLLEATVIRKHANLLYQRFILTNYSTGIAKRPEILAGIKTKRRRVAY